MTNQLLHPSRILFNWLSGIQATYILITAVWPLVDISSFMEVTGPKQDVWLVKTVSALLIPIAITLYMYLFIDTDHRPAIVLGISTSIALISIDFYYALEDVISDIYLLDGLVEVIFLVAWTVFLISRKPNRTSYHNSV